jgi:hypothetical protein
MKPDATPGNVARGPIVDVDALAWTDEMAIGNGSSAIRSILDLRAGRTPPHLPTRRC